MSSVPKARFDSSNSRLISAVFEKSAWMATALPPELLISATRAFAASLLVE
jgi:hypothetical protein